MTDRQAFTLLDGASPQTPIIAPELDTQKLVAADVTQALEERLEAYEDIMDSEVGDTTLSRSRNIEREVGLRAYIESGVSLDAKVSSELINTIFVPGTPLKIPIYLSLTPRS